MLAYAPPIFGVSTMLFFVQFFFLKFATDVLLLAPAIVGLIFALGRLWDAVTDPLVGTWSDRTRTRLGRRRPWMLVGAPLLGLTFAMTYMPPPSLSGGALVAWSTVALFGFYAALTAYLVPHQALGAELTPDHHDRSRIFGLRHASFTLGMMLAFGGMQFVNNAAEPRAAAAVLVTAVGIVFSIVLLLTPWRVRERRRTRTRDCCSSSSSSRWRAPGCSASSRPS
jgi:GPH family glycoside/pentoside/hexuronide:cation symporter